MTASSTFVENAGNFGSYDFPRFKDEVDEEVAKMAQQAVGEWKRIEKTMGENLFTGEKHRPWMVSCP